MDRLDKWDDYFCKSQFKYLVLAAASTTLSVIMLIVFVYLGALAVSPDKQNVPTNKLCLQCQSLLPEDEHKVPLVKELKGDIEMCCVSDGSQLVALLKKAIWKRKKEPDCEKFSASNYALAQAAAHMTLEPQNAMHHTSPHFPHDKTRIGLAFSKPKNNPVLLLNNVTTNSSSLTVQVPGMYYVYSNFHYRPTGGKSCSEVENKNWNSWVVLIHAGKRYELLKTVHTCKEPWQKDSNTRHTGGVFQLHSGDHLEIETNGYGINGFAYDMSYMGVFYSGRP